MSRIVRYLFIATSLVALGLAAGVLAATFLGDWAMAMADRDAVRI